jgi:hypothetical protein
LILQKGNRPAAFLAKIGSKKLWKNGLFYEQNRHFPEQNDPVSGLDRPP